MTRERNGKALYTNAFQRLGGLPEHKTKHIGLGDFLGEFGLYGGWRLLNAFQEQIGA